MPTFGENLRAARKAAGLSQKELADAVGAKHNSVSNWEKGQNNPSQPTIEKLCGVLGVSANDLFGSAQAQQDAFTYALFDEVGALNDENKQKLIEMAKFFRQQQEAGEK